MRGESESNLPRAKQQGVGLVISADLSQDEAEAILGQYLREVVPAAEVYGTGLVRLWRTVAPASIRPAIRGVVTDALSLLQRRVAARHARRTPLRLHLGSGARAKVGWVNIDLLGLPVDLAWNLTRPLPFPDNSVDAIFHEHVLEHLSLRQGLALTKECYRVLKPRGILRIGVPDAGAYVQSYCDASHQFLEAMRPGRPTPLLALQEEFYWHAHRCMYDFSTLSLVCRAAGFEELQRCRFGESKIVACPDSVGREGDSLYIEAVR